MRRPLVRCGERASREAAPPPDPSPPTHLPRASQHTHFLRRQRPVVVLPPLTLERGARGGCWLGDCGRHVAAPGHGQPLSCNLPVLLRSTGRLLLRPDPRCPSSTPGCRGRRATIHVAAAHCSWTWTKPGAQGGGSWREPRRAFIIRRRRHALGGWRLITSTFVCASCGMAVHGPWCFEIVGLTRSILL